MRRRFSTSTLTSLGGRCPRTGILMRPRYHTRVTGRTSIMNSAGTLLSCTMDDPTARFVITARDNVLRRVGGRYPSGRFVPIPPDGSATSYGRYGCVHVGALRGLCLYLHSVGPRVAISRRLHRGTIHPVLHVLRVDGWRPHVISYGKFVVSASVTARLGQLASTGHFSGAFLLISSGAHHRYLPRLRVSSLGPVVVRVRPNSRGGGVRALALV